MNRCVVVGAAEIKDYDNIRRYLSEEDFYIFCDGGLRHIEKLEIKPNLIVGDFDSHVNPECDIETIVLPCEKDDTDTVFAIKEGLKRGFESFVLIGVVGQRFDHTFGNIAVLLMLDSLNKQAIIIDDYSEMEIVSKIPKYVDNSCKYFSLLNISGKAKGVNIENAKYNLENAEITPEYQYGISNEVISDKQAKIYVNDGRLLLVKILKE